MKINIDKAILSSIIFLVVLKLIFSYLNVELGWWQRMLTPNYEKFNVFGVSKKFVRSLEFVLIPLIVLYLVKNIKHLKQRSILVFVGIVMILLNIGTAFLNSKTLLESFEYTFKIMSPIFLFICLIIHSEKYEFNIRKLMIRVLSLCVFLTLIGYSVFDESYNHDDTWMPIYFSSVHTHSYVLVLIGIGFSYLIFEKKKYFRFLLFCLLYFIYLYMAHRIRTPMAFFLIYLLFTSYTIHNIFKALWLKLIINIPLIIALFLFFVGDLNKFSSGRLVMYEAKYKMLQGFSFLEFIFGRGKGSDFIRTEYWVYEAKNSHNDILTFLVENGIPYALLFLFLVFLLIMIKGPKIKIIYTGILIGYLTTSFLSNGLVIRPIACYVFFIVLAYILTSSEKRITIDDS